MLTARELLNTKVGRNENHTLGVFSRQTGLVELAGDQTLVFPSRWVISKQTHEEDVKEIGKLGEIILKGAEAICGVYMRLCDRIRESDLSEDEIRRALEPHLPQPRISEIMRVSRSSKAIYSRYMAGFFGFKAALKECRGYTVTPDEELKQRKIHRTAKRLLDLMKGQGSVAVNGKTITIK